MLINVLEINENNRFIALFSNGKTTKFGQTNPKKGTYIDHNDKEFKKKYIKRHLKDLKTNDYTRPGYLSMFLLWNKETLKIVLKTIIRELKIMIGVLNKKII